MNNRRLMIIINNLLTEVTKTTDMDENTYLKWLEQEVGISKEEINELKENGLFPNMED